MEPREAARQIGQEIDRAVRAGGMAAAIAGAALRRLRPLVGARRAVVTRFDLAAGDGEWLAVDADTPTAIGAGARFPLAMMGDLAALGRGEAQAIDDVAAALGHLPQGRALLAEGVRAFVVLPLIAGGRLVGSLNFGIAVPGPVAAEHVALAREVADRIAAALAPSR